MSTVWTAIQAAMDAGAVMSAGDIADRVSAIEPDISRASVAPELRKRLRLGDLIQPSYGKYRLPRPDEDTRTFRSHVGRAGGRVAEPRNFDDSDEGDSFVSYPVYDVGIGAGPASVKQETGEYLMAPKPIISGFTGGSLPKQSEAYWTKIRGTSMEPWLPDGSPILVVKCDEIIQGGRYVIYMDDSDAEVVKRIERLGGGVLRIISDNPAHSTQVFRHLEDDMYEDVDNNLTARLRVRGVVVYPKDTGHAITKMLAQR